MPTKQHKKQSKRRTDPPSAGIGLPALMRQTK